ncbi:MAG TPA: carboxylating nicotinate-nucleotide diphosphorylase [Acidimicrobiales bacterium]|nr:carboxylating nicotinate-nucleotide diphosphorylase [Acidimicrobiales bacterium]
MNDRDDLDPPSRAVVAAVALALDEDTLPMGDLTAGLVGASVRGTAYLRARREGVIAGTACALEVVRQVDPRLVLDLDRFDGSDVTPGVTIGTLKGPFRSLLTAERSVLNFLSHLSGVATLTRRYVDAARAVNPHVRVLDTRKTTPGLRALEKAAVRAGGGTNHRGSLSEGVLVKDNHLGELSIESAVELAARRWPGRMIEVECDRLDQVERAASAGAGIILCDNMSPDLIVDAVKSVRRIAGRRCLVEVSGEVSLETIAEYAAAGPDFISVGAITHSAPILNLGLDLDLDLDLEREA